MAEECAVAPAMAAELGVRSHLQLAWERRAEAAKSWPGRDGLTPTYHRHQCVLGFPASAGAMQTREATPPAALGFARGEGPIDKLREAPVISDHPCTVFLHPPLPIRELPLPPTLLSSAAVFCEDKTFRFDAASPPSFTRPVVAKMKSAAVLSLLSVLASADAAETVLGAYIFHRHGDRTPKSLPPANLTTLGYGQVYSSGQYYRSRYLTGSSKIKGINEDIVKLAQLSVTAPVDNVLQNSAMAFLQGLYPPVGQTIQTLANGSKVQAPMDGYQLIPVNTISTGTGSEDNGWLQDATSCANAKVSSNSYFTSTEYNSLLSSTKDFYSSLVPVVNGTFGASDVTFKNAYVVYDLINVAEIHNETIPDSSVLTNSTLLQVRTLADAHEWGLAYNASDNMRAISGMQLAGEILKYLNSTITSGQKGSSSNKFGIQFGAYATFFSFFGLADLPKANPDFMGVPDYASSMAFELFTNADVSSGFPSVSDLQVRFLFHNGSASNASQPTVYPLFGGSDNAVSWSNFSSTLGKFAVSTTEQWCHKCGNTTGSCAIYSGSNTQSTTGAQSGGKSHMSAAIGGVIGAFVTLALVLGSLAAFMLLGGFRLVSKKSLAGRVTPVSETAVNKA